MKRFPKSLLIVDDEEMIRDTLEAYFQALGCMVYSVSSGEQALEILAGFSPEAAIVDMRLPGMSGQDMLHAALAVRPAMRSLIYTGSLEYHLSEKLLGSGMTSEQIFVKPVEDMRILADALAALVSEETPGEAGSP